MSRYHYPIKPSRNNKIYITINERGIFIAANKDGLSFLARWLDWLSQQDDDHIHLKTFGSHIVFNFQWLSEKMRLKLPFFDFIFGASSLLDKFAEKQQAKNKKSFKATAFPKDGRIVLIVKNPDGIVLVGNKKAQKFLAQKLRFLSRYSLKSNIAVLTSLRLEHHPTFIHEKIAFDPLWLKKHRQFIAFDLSWLKKYCRSNERSFDLAIIRIDNPSPHELLEIW